MTSTICSLVAISRNFTEPSHSKKTAVRSRTSADRAPPRSRASVCSTWAARRASATSFIAGSFSARALREQPDLDREAIPDVGHVLDAAVERPGHGLQEEHDHGV